MTKQELIASAIVGKAHIDAWASVTSYRITPTSDGRGEPVDYPLIVVSIKESDSSICDDSYFTDGVNEHELTGAEARILQQAIDEVMLRAP